MRKTYIVVISIIVLLSIITFSTYAMFTQDINIGEFVNLTASTLPTESNITEYERITIPASVSRTIDLNITNSTSNSLYYGVWYEMVDPSTINSNINIGKLTGSTNATIGQLASNGNITVQICIVNNSTDDIIINVGVGYSSTNSLNLPTGRSVITGEAQPEYIASDYIISLSQGDTYAAGSGNGVYKTNNHEYRYVGGEVDNWVRFNNDDYRIIGVFDANSHGVTGQNLIKLIAANKLTAASWGVYNTTASSGTYSSYKNDWTGTTTGVKASANVLLNEYFLNANNTSQTYGECINWTYGNSNNTHKSKNCSNIVGYGIQSNELRNYIQPVTWYLYGYNSNDLNKQNWYQCERNNYTGCTSGNNGAYSGTTEASIGLMYVSDYMYASSYIASNDTTTTGESFFVNSNWLYNGEEWTITPKGSSDNFSFLVDETGWLYDEDYCSGDSLGLRPTFYLKSTIKIKSGSGSFNNPYIIG